MVTNGRRFLLRKKNATAPSRTNRSNPASPPMNSSNRDQRPLPHPQRNPHRPLPQRSPAKSSLRTAARATFRLPPLRSALRPHLANCGSENTAWVGDYKGVPMFLAQHDGTHWPSPAPFPGKRCLSDSSVLPTDGRTSRLTSRCNGIPAAPKTATSPAPEKSIYCVQGEFILALGFGSIVTEAGTAGRSTLIGGLQRTLLPHVFHGRTGNIIDQAR